MVSELIQYLQISVQTSVFNLPKSLSFQRNATNATNWKSCLNSRVSLTFQATAFQYFWSRLQNSRLFFLKISKEIGKAWRKSLVRAKESLTFVWLLARTWISKNTDCFAIYFWSIELNPISLDSSLNTDCIHWSVSRRSSDAEFSVRKAYSLT